MLEGLGMRVYGILACLYSCIVLEIEEFMHVIKQKH
jgi:hypothetical protein